MAVWWGQETPHTHTHTHTPDSATAPDNVLLCSASVFVARVVGGGVVVVCAAGTCICVGVGVGIGTVVPVAVFESARFALSIHRVSVCCLRMRLLRSVCNTSAILAQIGRAIEPSTCTFSLYNLAQGTVPIGR